MQHSRSMILTFEGTGSIQQLSFSHQRWRGITLPHNDISRIIPAAMVLVLSLSLKLLLASALEEPLDMVALLRLSPESP